MSSKVTPRRNVTHASRSFEQRTVGGAANVEECRRFPTEGLERDVEACLDFIGQRWTVVSTPALYFVNLVCLGVPIGKCLGVSGAVLLFSLLRYGERALAWFGVVLTAYALGVWIGVMPSLGQWQRLIARTFP